MARIAALFSLVALLLVAVPSLARAAETGLAESSLAPVAQTTADDLAGDARAGGHETPGPISKPKKGMLPAIMALVVFTAVLGFLGTVVWPKISTALDERSAKIQGEIDAAEEARAQARQALEQYEASLAEARAEAQKMIDETKAQQAALAAELRAKSEAELNQLKDRARREIESAKRAAISEIYAHTATLASSVAGKILERELSASDHQKLVDEAIGELASTGQA